MTEAILEAPTAATAGNDRAAQRLALRDLADLAAQGAAAEERIEQNHQSALERLEQERRQALEQLDRDHQLQRESIEAERARQAEEIEAKWNSRRAALEQSDAEALRRLRSHDAAVERNIHHAYEQEKWLADSVLEVDQNQIRAESAAARKALSEQVAAVEASASEARALVRSYGVEPAPETSSPGAIAPEQAADEFARRRQAVVEQLQRLRALKMPRLFKGVMPYLLIAIVCIVAAVVAQWLIGGIPWSDFDRLRPAWRGIEFTVAGVLVVAVIGGLLLQQIARSRLQEVFDSLQDHLAAAREAAERQEQFIQQIERRRTEEAVAKHHGEVERVREKHMPALTQAQQNRDAELARMTHQLEQELDSVERGRREEMGRVEAERQRRMEDAQQEDRRKRQAIEETYEQQRQGSLREYEEARTGLAQRLKEGLSSAGAPIAGGAPSIPAQEEGSSAWEDWTPPERFVSLIRFGQMEVDLRQIAGGDHNGHSHVISLPPAFSTPAYLAFPQQASLLIEHDPARRDQALRTLQLVMVRLLTGLPPGRVRFTLIDPVGLGQNFAGFMHLADYDDALIGGRIWTESGQIDQRLNDLTEHMETVIQKYLRNEYPTIDDYNRQAGELAEPYRFLVIADFPSGFSEDALRRLSSIVSSGARCGVYTLIASDQRQRLASALLEDLVARSVHLAPKAGTDAQPPEGQFVWKDEVFGRFPLTLDQPPDQTALTRLMEQVGRAAQRAKRVEEPFSAIAPPAGQVWSRESHEELSVPIGRTGATRLQSLRLGRGVAQHALVGGKTGSGKSTLLHALITNAALWYSPREIELYLIDFKRGVEFKTYATHALPHARAVAVESDREFGLSVLQRLDAELGRRGELFRRAGVQDLPAYRRAESTPLPRVLLVIDEFQEFFTEEDRLAQEAALLLDRLVRQGRAFGIHLLLGSQTISGASGLARSTLGQMAVRIALQTSEADSQLILGDDNLAARLLDRPGEAIYNDAGGLVEGNSPFQVAWLDDAKREMQLSRIADLARERGFEREPPIVFEGSVAADIEQNRVLERMLHEKPSGAPSAPVAFLGEPVAIKAPTSVAFRRQSGANLLIIGQQEESALAMLAAAVISLAAQHRAGEARFVVFDATAGDSPLAGYVERLGRVVPQEVQVVPWRDTGEVIGALATELEQRQAAEAAGQPAVYVLFHGLQRYRMLRKGEEDFSFSMDAEEKPADPSKQFGDLLREGPALGVHVLCWCDTPAAVERTLERGLLREFDHRVLFQMSANDSSNLIDSPAANKLGFHRALAYSEEQGTLEKFRPYALPEAAWLQRVEAALGRTAS